MLICWIINSILKFLSGFACESSYVVQLQRRWRRRWQRSLHSYSFAVRILCHISKLHQQPAVDNSNTHTCTHKTYIEETHSIPYRSHHYLGERRSRMEHCVCVCMCLHFRSISETAYAVHQFFLGCNAFGRTKGNPTIENAALCALSTSLISLHQSIYFLCGAQITYEHRTNWSNLHCVPEFAAIAPASLTLFRQT